MTSSLSRLNHKVGALTTNHPWKVILVSLILFVMLAMGGKHLGFSTNYRVFFAEGNPQLQEFEALEAVFSKTDNAMFVIKPKTGTVFSPDVLTLVQELTEASWQLPYSKRVDSITNYQYSRAEGDTLIVADLVEQTPTEYSADELQALQEIALGEPLLRGQLISDDATTTAVNITANLTREDPFEVPVMVAAVREMLEKYRTQYPEIEIRPSGMVLMNNAFMESSMKDMQTIIPLMYGIIIVTMLLFLRSLWATIATVFVIFFSASSAMGFGGWMGFPLTPPSAGTPTIVLTLAVADSIHIIVSMLGLMRKGMEKKEAIREALRINLQPILLTSITTIIGFLSLNFSEAPPFWHLGNMTAFGIGAAFFYSIFFLPAALTLLPVKVKVSTTVENSLMSRFSHFVIGRQNILLLGSIFVIGFAIYQCTKIETNDQYVQYFDHSISFRGDTEFMMENLTGIHLMEYQLASQETVSNPDYLHDLQAFGRWLKSQKEVRHVYSISEIYRRLNKNMHEDNPEFYQLPEDGDLAAQYLLLYEMSLPYGLDLNDRINIDKSASRLTVTLHDLSTNEIRAFKTRSENWLKENTMPSMHSEATGPMVMFSFISKRNIDSMIKGNFVSLLLISLLIMLALKSFKIGTLSLIPNLVPVALGYGAWAFFIGQINLAASIAAAVSLGIIVDDTVHFLSKYVRARREKGLSPEKAVDYAFNTVGPALIITTFILLAGFGALTQSAFQVNSYLGLLTMLVIGSALIADFLLLPVILLKIDKFTSKI